MPTWFVNDSSPQMWHNEKREGFNESRPKAKKSYHGFMAHYFQNSMYEIISHDYYLFRKCTHQNFLLLQYIDTTPLVTTNSHFFTRKKCFLKLRDFLTRYATWKNKSHSQVACILTIFSSNISHMITSVVCTRPDCHVLMCAGCFTLIRKTYYGKVGKLYLLSHAWNFVLK